MNDQTAKETTVPLGVPPQLQFAGQRYKAQAEAEAARKEAESN